MAAPQDTGRAGDVITVEEYARRFRVETEDVRRWVRNKAIPFEMVNGRKMIRTADALLPVPTPGNPELEEAIKVLAARDGMPPDLAREVANGLHIDELKDIINGR